MDNIQKDIDVWNLLCYDDSVGASLGTGFIL